MDFNNKSKKELVEMLESLQRTLSGYSEQPLLIKEIPVSKQSDLEVLIGTIPFLLLNEKIFEKNQDIAEFASRLSIWIPSAEKKKREDMIGRIISAIARFDSIRIRELNIIIKSLMQSGLKNKSKSNFFKDWEKVIREMKI